MEKKWRICIDYRKVNEKMTGDRYPLPRIDKILDNLGRAKYFSIIDLYAGFHQVKLEKASRDITTFSTENESFRWKVLPFGLNISPNSFYSQDFYHTEHFYTLMTLLLLEEVKLNTSII